MVWAVMCSRRAFHVRDEETQENFTIVMAGSFHPFPIVLPWSTVLPSAEIGARRAQSSPSSPEELRKGTQGQPMRSWVEMSWSGSSLHQWDLGDRWTNASCLWPQLSACSNLHTGCVPEDPSRPCLHVWEVTCSWVHPQ